MPTQMSREPEGDKDACEPKNVNGFRRGSIVTRRRSRAPKITRACFTLPKQGATLLSHYRGRVVALEFILTTCPHCQAAAKTMSKMQASFGTKGLQALDVAIDPNADRLLERFAKEHGAAFPVGWVSLEQMMSFMGFTERPTVPQLVLIDRRGTIRYQTPRLGDSEAMKEDVLDRRIQELL